MITCRDRRSAEFRVAGSGWYPCLLVHHPCTLFCIPNLSVVPVVLCVLLWRCLQTKVAVRAVSSWPDDHFFYAHKTTRERPSYLHHLLPSSIDLTPSHIMTMSPLIVDFPSSNSLESPKKKTVHFSISSKMMIFQAPDESDASSLWYSKEDYQDMKQDTKRAVLRAQKRLPTLASTDLESMNDVDVMGDAVLTGIENLLTPNAIKRTKIRRRKCVQAVLEEQERQYYARVQDVGSIASASYLHSKPASRTARTIGLTQSGHRQSS